MFEDFSPEHDAAAAKAGQLMHEALWLFERALKRDMITIDHVSDVVLAVTPVMDLLEQGIPLRKGTQALFHAEIAPLAVKCAGLLQIRDEKAGALEPGLVVRIAELAAKSYNAQWWSTSENGVVYPGQTVSV